MPSESHGYHINHIISRGFDAVECDAFGIQTLTAFNSLLNLCLILFDLQDTILCLVNNDSILKEKQTLMFLLVVLKGFHVKDQGK